MTSYKKPIHKWYCIGYPIHYKNYTTTNTLFTQEYFLIILLYFNQGFVYFNIQTTMGRFDPNHTIWHLLHLKHLKYQILNYTYWFNLHFNKHLKCKTENKIIEFRLILKSYWEKTLKVRVQITSLVVLQLIHFSLRDQIIHIFNIEFNVAMYHWIFPMTLVQCYI